MTQAGQRLTAAGKEDYVEVDGFRIRSWEVGPPRPSGAVVMLEGMTWGLSTLRDALAQKYRVIALELPGFGESPANTRSQSVQELADTVAQAAAQVVSEPYTLIGTSFGCPRGTLADPAVAGHGRGPGVDCAHRPPARGRPSGWYAGGHGQSGYSPIPRRPGALRPLTPPSWLRNRRWCSGSREGCTMQRQNAGSVRFRARPWCSLVRKTGWWHPRPRASTVRGFPTALSPLCMTPDTSSRRSGPRPSSTPCVTMSSCGRRSSWAARPASSTRRCSGSPSGRDFIRQLQTLRLQG